MKKFTQCVMLAAVAAVVPFMTGCGGGGGSETPATVTSSASVKMGEVKNYDQGVAFAAPEGWEEANRQSKIIVKFDNPNLDGQSVFVKNPVPSDVQTLTTVDDAKNSGLKGELVTIGDYNWMRLTQRSRDSRTEDKFDNLNCTTVQFGKAYTVTVRGYEGQNDNCDAIMNSVLEKIKFSEQTTEPAVTIDENTEFNVDF
ncbi:MAG: hypothetical protein Q4C70_06750 [Planctomycetia bacterium]|nr:hypothetical protein [Planctomycetia bacterium]